MPGDPRAALARFPDAPPGTCRWCGRGCAPDKRSHRACRDAAKVDRDHRAITLQRGEDTCTYQLEGPCDGPLESHHVQARTDNGDPGWTVLACRHHHQQRTREQNARRKANTVAKTGTKTKPEPPRPEWVERHQWIRYAIACAIIGAGLLIFTGHTRISQLRDYAIADLGAVAALVVAIEWRAHRHAQRARLAYALARAAHTDPTQLAIVRARRWRHGSPTIGAARYSSAFDDAEGSRGRAGVEEMLHRKIDPDLVVGWDARRDRVTWRPRRDDEPAAAAAPLEPAQLEEPGDSFAERVQAELRSVMKGGAIAARTTYDERGHAHAITVTYPEGVRDDSDEVRASVQAIVNAKLPGRWRATWDTINNQVVFELRPPMPAKVPHPSPDQVPTLGDGRHLALPFALDEHHDPVRWDWRLAPHCLVAGETGSGKTVVLRALIYRAAHAGAQVLACDPKRTELAGLRSWPNVREVATSTEDMIALVGRVHLRMDRRYAESEAAIEAGQPTPEFEPILLVIDEAREWLDRVNDHWKATKIRGQSGSEHPVVEKWRSIARLGRTANVHMLVGIQRPDAKQFGGESRDNYRLRIATGSLSPEGARMMFGRTDVGTDVPADPPGRATVQLGSGQAAEVQVYWTPDAHLAVGDDAAILDALRPQLAIEAVPEPAPEPEPAAEQVHPEQLARGDHVLWDGDRMTVLDWEADEADDQAIAVRWRGPDGAERVDTWDANDWLERVP